MFVYIYIYIYIYICVCVCVGVLSRGMGQGCFFSALARMTDFDSICGKIFFDKHLLKTFSIMLSGNFKYDWFAFN